VERSGLRPVLDSHYAMADLHAALDRLEAGRQFGKIAIETIG
jgi:NADPH:quinone reductase-like Zn-dependent oxidoreductase